MSLCFLKAAGRLAKKGRVTKNALGTISRKLMVQLLLGCSRTTSIDVSTHQHIVPKTKSVSRSCLGLVRRNNRESTRTTGTGEDWRTSSFRLQPARSTIFAGTESEGASFSFSTPLLQRASQRHLTLLAHALASTGVVSNIVLRIVVPCFAYEQMDGQGLSNALWAWGTALRYEAQEEMERDGSGFIPVRHTTGDLQDDPLCQHSKTNKCSSEQEEGDHPQLESSASSFYMTEKHAELVLSRLRRGLKIPGGRWSCKNAVVREGSGWRTSFSPVSVSCAGPRPRATPLVVSPQGLSNIAWALAYLTRAATGWHADDFGGKFSVEVPPPPRVNKRKSALLTKKQDACSSAVEELFVPPVLIGSLVQTLCDLAGQQAQQINSRQQEQASAAPSNKEVLWQTQELSIFVWAIGKMAVRAAVSPSSQVLATRVDRNYCPDGERTSSSVVRDAGSLARSIRFALTALLCGSTAIASTSTSRVTNAAGPDNPALFWSAQSQANLLSGCTALSFRHSCFLRRFLREVVLPFSSPGSSTSCAERSLRVYCTGDHEERNAHTTTGRPAMEGGLLCNSPPTQTAAPARVVSSLYTAKELVVILHAYALWMAEQGYFLCDDEKMFTTAPCKQNARGARSRS
ncbi:unnamed protein product [Amoebophrya sp. A120]|nr:unnamed protein product [Amoebophrya sp. A120]|eukprot:GSA120T00021567001.1